MTALDLVAATDRTWSASLGVVEAAAEARGFGAIASAFPLLSWPGRSFYEGHSLHHRVVVYDAGSRASVAVLDTLRYFNVHELAFHPSEPILAIATGEYDGGCDYEGELILWNWVTGQVQRPVAGREVVRVRWRDTHQLAVLTKPENDEDEDETGPILCGAVVRADVGEHDNTIGNEPVTPESLGFDGECAPRPLNGGLSRPHIWDLAFVEGGSIVVASDVGVTLWDAGLRRSRHLDTPGRAVQILQPPSRLLAHVVERAEQGDVSVLYALRGPGLVDRRAFDRPYLFSVSGPGEILARDASFWSRNSERRDVLLDSSGEELAALDLGHFDCFNHALRLDRGVRTAFLRGTPPGSYQGKFLANVNARGTVSRVAPWDDGKAHRMHPTACWAGPDVLISGWYTHHPYAGKGTAHVERRDLGASEPRWRIQLRHAPIALAFAEQLGAIIWATLDGEVGLLDVGTGAVLARQHLRIDGLLTPPTAIAVRADRLAVGTLDGRVLLLAL